MEQARSEAGGKNVKIGGGVSMVRQYPQVRLVDEIYVATEAATHLMLTR
nr:hypothetical protein [Pseudohalocynthiibacter aestuariivivens]